MEAIISTIQYHPDRFDKLAAIPHPRYHNKAYERLLMKLNSTLQRVVIKLNGSGNREMLPLFDSLATFKCLTSIGLQGLLDRLALLEIILGGCSLLQEVAVNIQFLENIRTKDDMTTWLAANINIAHNKGIKSLTITDDYRADLLELFVYKYPNMKSIVIKAEKTMSDLRENIKRTFTAVKQIPSRKVKLVVNENELLHALKQLLPLDLQFTLKEEDEVCFCIEINSP
ncbi:hypothetical protein V8B55DRAFT_1542781 [Mucor lusitanicus]|uniref:Uncharacterized protein n=2 Tax=Mucor circinelloides f. lusitanicus TaxID=29924 RepID=A0A168NIN8_MUCCL|nr:hypothetical protein FB192DRAFT_1389123 [Mucor lusitanicus]OAD06321.1 hypothetical protein MUCCIDRAFT_106892 [Mucor lusitanicus CBS 277.49]